MEEGFQIVYFVDHLVGFNCAVVQNDDSVTHLPHFLHDVGGEDDRRKPTPKRGSMTVRWTLNRAKLFTLKGREFGKILDECTNLDELVRVETCGGLVQDEQFGVADKGLRQADTLAIAFAQFADMFVPLGRETDEIYERAYPQQCSTDSHRQSDRAELFTHKGKGAFSCGQPRHEFEVFGDVHLLIKGIILRQISDRCGHRDGTAIGFPKPHENLHERRFAGSVRA